jgi:hypothetical protein
MCLAATTARCLSESRDDAWAEASAPGGIAQLHPWYSNLTSINKDEAVKLQDKISKKIEFKMIASAIGAYRMGYDIADRRDISNQNYFYCVFY